MHGIEAGTGSDLTGPEMTSWQPEVEKKSRDTVIDRFNKILLTFFLHYGVGVLSIYCRRSGLPGGLSRGGGIRVV